MRNAGLYDMGVRLAIAVFVVLVKEKLGRSMKNHLGIAYHRSGFAMFLLLCFFVLFFSKNSDAGR